MSNTLEKYGQKLAAQDNPEARANALLDSIAEPNESLDIDKEAQLTAETDQYDKILQETRSKINKKEEGEDTTFKTQKNDIASGLQQAAAGVADAVEGTINTGIDLWNWADDMNTKMGWPSVRLSDKQPEPIDVVSKIFPKPKNTAEAIMRPIVNFVVPFAAASKVFKVGKAASTVGRAVKAGSAGAFVDFAAFDPNNDRLSNFVQEFKGGILANPVAEYLAHEPSNDATTEGRLEERFKNSLEGFGIGVAVDGVFKAVQMVRKSNIAKKGMQTATGTKPSDLEIQKANAKQAKKIEEALGVKSKETLADDAAKGVKQVEEPSPTGVSVDKDGQVKVDLNRLDVGEVEKTIGNLAKRTEDQTRGVITDPQMLAEAEARMINPVQVKKILGKKPGEAFTPEDLTAIKQVEVGAAEDVVIKANKLGDSEEELAVFADVLSKYEHVHIVTAGGEAEAGRSLRMLGVVAKGQKQAFMNEVVQHLLKLNGGKEGLLEMKNMLKDIHKKVGSYEKFNGVIRKKPLGKNMREWVYETWINGLLSNPVTHAKNFVSNSGMVGRAATERAWASKLTAKSNYKNSVAKGEGTAFLSGATQETYAQAKKLVNTTFDAFKMMGKLLHEKQLGEGVGKWFKDVAESGFDEADKLDIVPMSTAQRFDVDSNWKHVWNVMDSMRLLPGKALAKSDQFFKAINYRAEIHAQAHRKAMADGLSGDAFEEAVEAYTKNPPDNLRISAQEFSRYNTFTNDLASGGWGEKFDDIIKTPAPGTDVKLLRAFFPFVRTNVNITARAFENLPLRAIPGMRKQYLQEIAQGGATEQLARARMQMGTTALGIVSAMAYKGMISGNGPNDRKTRVGLEAAGWKPNSLHVGDTQISFDGMDPFAMLMSVGADLGFMASQGADVSEAISHTALAFSHLLTPEMLTSGLSDMMVLFEDSSIDGGFNRLAQRKVPTLLPFSSLLRKIRQDYDPIKRDTHKDEEGILGDIQSVVDSVKNTIPGWSKSLPGYKNIWGEDVIYPPGIGPDIASPFFVNKDDTSPIAEELKKIGVWGELNESLDEGESHLMFTMPERFIKREVSFGKGLKQPITVKLSNEQYSRFVELSAGKDLIEFGGHPLKSALNDVVKGGYKDAPKLKDGTVSDQAKRLVIKAVISQYRKAARQQLLDEFDDITNKINKKKLSAGKAVLGNDIELSGDE